jgi:hypothetical protein
MKSLGLSRNPPLSVQPPAAKTHHRPEVQFTASRPTHNLSFRLHLGLSCDPVPSVLPTKYLDAFLTSQLSSTCFLLTVVRLNIWRYLMKNKVYKASLYMTVNSITRYLPFRVPTHSPWRFVLKDLECKNKTISIIISY